jgi:hypothetical protein
VAKQYKDLSREARRLVGQPSSKRIGKDGVMIVMVDDDLKVRVDVNAHTISIEESGRDLLIEPSLGEWKRLKFAATVCVEEIEYDNRYKK